MTSKLGVGKYSTKRNLTQTWTFSVDESKTVLNNLPFFSFGQVVFRPKNRGETRKNSPSVKQKRKKPSRLPQVQVRLKVDTPPPGERRCVAGREYLLPWNNRVEWEMKTTSPAKNGRGKSIPNKAPLWKSGTKQQPAVTKKKIHISLMMSSGHARQQHMSLGENSRRTT